MIDSARQVLLFSSILLQDVSNRKTVLVFLFPVLARSLYKYVVTYIIVSKILTITDKPVPVSAAGMKIIYNRNERLTTGHQRPRRGNRGLKNEYMNIYEN